MFYYKLIIYKYRNIKQLKLKNGIIATGYDELDS